MSQAGVPGALRSAIENSLVPVRPLWRPGVRALALVPLALLALVAIRLRGVRIDADQLGFVFLWGLSVLQVVAGLLLLVMALRESVPGEPISRRGMALGLGALVVWLAGVSWATWNQSPTPLPTGHEGLYWRVCVSRPVVLGLPLLAGALFLARRAYPLRPALVGAICGLGAGLVIDGGWRTYCEVSLPGHILNAHLLALAALMALGALAGALVSRQKDVPYGDQRQNR